MTRPWANDLSTLEVGDATFSGFAGQRIRAWLMMPRRRPRALPVVVQFVGYGGGRGLPYDWLLWPSAGYATLIMDTRGQGGTWSPGDTPDADAEAGGGPQHPGFVTRGIQSPATYYYRRLYTDAVRAVDAVRTHPAVDPLRVVVAGASQGGGMAQAVAGLVQDIQAALIDVPFLCDIERAITITDDLPYAELARFLAVHRDRVDDTLRTVAYVEGMHLASRATAPALYSVGLTDTITPPSSVFAAFNHYAGPKRISVAPFSGHDAGSLHHVTDQLRFLEELGLSAT